MLDIVNKLYLFKSEALGSLPIRITRKVFKMYLGPVTVSLEMMCLFFFFKNYIYENYQLKLAYK